MAAAFVALRIKGETAEELIGAALALRAAARAVPAPAYLFADSCGTGGDFSGSINVSTAAGIVAAACGLPVVKHGNRSFTSKCGSADVLEALGARLDLDAARIARNPRRDRLLLPARARCTIPGMQHAGPVRRAAEGPDDHESARPVPQSGAAEGAAARRRRSQAAPADRRDAARRWASSGRWSFMARGSTRWRFTASRERCGCRGGELEELEITPEEAGLRAPAAGADRRRRRRSENAQRLRALARRTRRRGRRRRSSRSTPARC